jgi:hypothetical protein
MPYLYGQSQKSQVSTFEVEDWKTTTSRIGGVTLLVAINLGDVEIATWWTP